MSRYAICFLHHREWSSGKLHLLLYLPCSNMVKVSNDVQIKELNSQGYEVILVTSGAVGLGRQRLRYRRLVNSRFCVFSFSCLNSDVYASSIF